MGINDTTTHKHTAVGASVYRPYIITVSHLVKERPWAEQLTSLPKRGSGSSFLFLKNGESLGTWLGVGGFFE